MKAAVKSALRVVLSIALVVFIAELLVMVALMQFAEFPPLAGALIDATLLTLIIAPALYMGVYRHLIHEIQQRQDAEIELCQALDEQRGLNAKLTQARDQLIQSEKLVSMGQIAAGVAHEINNPIGFIGSNLSTLENYAGELIALLNTYESCHPYIKKNSDLYLAVSKARAAADIDYLKTDISSLLAESLEGITRVKRIVKDLKDFSRSDDGVREQADLNHELERTLNIVNNQLKYHTKLVKKLQPLPLVECVPAQINQVFLNILVNAGQAIAQEGIITLSTQALADEVCISISDTGSGMTDEQKTRLFEPFYTTKPRDKGTGLGLSVSWGIISKHGGRIEVDSVLGTGTSFRIYLPLRLND